MPPANTASRPLDEAIRAIPSSWFKPSPFIYWSDLLVSAGIGWTSVVLAATHSGWIRAGWLAVAGLALYRAALFTHEITHRASQDVPGFTTAWNILVGVPVLMPSFMYEGVHLDHHRARTYGTVNDPEYVPFGRRSPVMLVRFVLLSFLTQAALAVRFAIVAPVSWAIPSLRAWVLEHGSSLVINHLYVRRHEIGAAGLAQEAGACVLLWGGAALWWAAVLPSSFVLCWIIATSIAFGVNAIRTLAAHRYDHDDDELSMTEQLLDSCTIHSDEGIVRGMTISMGEALRALVAPVGLRYHALHHWIPSLPYHRLGRTHRLLVATLRKEAPYYETIEPGLTPALADLVRRSAARSARPNNIIISAE